MKAITRSRGKKSKPFNPAIKQGISEDKCLKK